jgi:Skp family chaperone for outer membrane proteins
MSTSPKPESKTSASTPTFPDTSKILEKMDKDLEEMRKRFDQLLKKMDEDIEKLRKSSS